MAFSVETTAQAERDGEDILQRLLSEGAGDTGIRWFLGLEDAIASLAESPERCLLAPENEKFSFEVRQLVYGRRPHLYRILFTIDKDVVYVLRIRHGRRDRLTQH